MPNLKLIEKNALEEVFETQSGYILDLNNSDFETLVLEATKLNIYDAKYELNGSSKAKRFYYFIEVESNLLVAKLLNTLLDYKKQKGLITFSLGNSENVVEKLINRLESDNSILVSTEITENSLTSEFALEQLIKLKEKLSSDDFDGAIVNARTLLEDVICKAIYPSITGQQLKSAGDLLQDWKALTKVIGINEDEKDKENAINQIVRGLNGIINGLAFVTNSMSERHSQKYKPEKRHALLVIHSTITITEFLFDSLDFYKIKNNNLCP